MAGESDEIDNTDVKKALPGWISIKKVKDTFNGKTEKKWGVCKQQPL